MNLIDEYNTLPRYNDPKAASTTSSCSWRGEPVRCSNSCRCSLASEWTAVPLCYGIHFQRTWKYEQDAHEPEHSSQIRWAHFLSSDSSPYLFWLMVRSWGMGSMKECTALKTWDTTCMQERILEIAQNGRVSISAPLTGMTSGLSMLDSLFGASKILSSSFRS